MFDKKKQPLYTSDLGRAMASVICLQALPESVSKKTYFQLDG